MFTRIKIISIITAILVSGSFAPWCNASLFGPTYSPQEPNYVPDEIIVKFEQAVADSLEQQLAEGNTVDELRLTPSLENLNNIYKVINIEPVIKNFKAERERIENLLKKEEALLTKKERHLVRRLRRAPTGATVPDLGRIYKLEFEPNQPAPETAAEYNDDPDVEYAELNYILRFIITPYDPNYYPNDPNYYPEQWALHNDG